ncbi:MAG: hypothetical protein ACLPVY_04760 [Acidimicrobiia bacterium]
MPQFLFGCSVGALIAACASAPFLVPWPLRVRYLVTAPMTDPWFGLGPVPLLDMRAVLLCSVEREGRDVELVFAEIDTGHNVGITLRSAYLPGAVAQLDGWMARRTPLLLINDGHAHVYGPDGAVTDLTFAREKIR